MKLIQKQEIDPTTKKLKVYFEYKTKDITFRFFEHKNKFVVTVYTLTDTNKKTFKTREKALEYLYSFTLFL